MLIDTKISTLCTERLVLLINMFVDYTQLKEIEVGYMSQLSLLSISHTKISQIQAEGLLNL